ncbi:MAG: M3 family metallopeptidase [Deltaproteobacteria bacterium]|nr:M3 family metallopeptidase [Deltaproteobacteria bacterium]
MFIIVVDLITMSCNRSEEKVVEKNPLLTEYNTPFNVPPFDRIKPFHFMPAFEEGMKQQNDTIDRIIKDNEPASFENTIEALDKSGETLDTVLNIFYELKTSDTNKEIDAIDQEISPRLALHRNRITLNSELFKRIKSLHERRDSLNLNDEQAYLLEQLFKSYVQNGALLTSSKDRERLTTINQELASLTVKFNQNLLAETNDFKLVIEDPSDLEGLPDQVVQEAASAAEKLGLKGKWVFTTPKSSMLPFLTYSPRRELREKLYNAYIQRGNNNNANDNKGVIARIIKLRLEKANLLGYKTYAAYQLENRMAKNADSVYKLLNRVWESAIPAAKEERDEMQSIIDAEGGKFKLASWDWWYYAEKVRKKKYNLEDSELRPYFELARVRNGMFQVANMLYGITLHEKQDIPKPHKDAFVFEVKDRDGSHLAILYMDFFARASKQQGAWCGGYQYEYMKGGKRINPVITTVFNFSKPTQDSPALLELDEVKTMYHEFGHAIDAIFSEKTYHMEFYPTDFVELPSQLMEHWALHPDVLPQYAKHYLTGEPIPQELVKKIISSKFFNKGFNNVEYLAASLLDMEYHTMKEAQNLDIVQFERNCLDNIGLISEIEPRYHTTYFSHIINYYPAGYYSYIWSAVLDNDVFDAFREAGILNQDTASRFRKEILAKSGSRDSMELFKSFRGREPEIEPLLRERGFLVQEQKN